MSKVRIEAFCWGAGTALGKLPPYFMARAHRLSRYESDSQSALAMKKGGSSPKVVPAPQLKASIRTADKIARKLTITVKSLMHNINCV